jgi:aryl-alcohol dehydrogenase-like predicted oxidoreductase
MLLSTEGKPNRDRAVATIRASLTAGVTLIDTADAYHSPADERGHNELLFSDVLREFGPDSVVVATKGGRVRSSDGAWLTDGRPEHLIDSAKLSALRLGVDAIALYQLHAPDPRVPFRDSLEALGHLVDSGVAIELGVSNVNVGELELAHDVLGPRLVSVQNQFSPTALHSKAVLDLAEALGLAFIAWRPLGSVVSGMSTSNAETTFGEVARAHGASIQQVILSWQLAQSAAVIPIPGSTRPETATASAAAAELVLNERDLELLATFGVAD